MRGEDRPYHHGALPDALLAAVGTLIAEQGLGAVSLRSAAREAGVSHAAPAHHFGDKAGLLAAFAEQGFEAFTAALEDARATPGTPEERLAAMARAYLAFADTQRPWFEVMFRPELTPGRTDQVHAAGARSFAVLVEHLRDCLAPEAGDDEALKLALGTWAGVHGLAQLRVDGTIGAIGVEPELAAEAVLSLVLEGLRAHPHWRGEGTAGAEHGPG